MRAQDSVELILVAGIVGLSALVAWGGTQLLPDGPMLDRWAVLVSPLVALGEGFIAILFAGWVKPPSAAAEGAAITAAWFPLPVGFALWIGLLSPSVAVLAIAAGVGAWQGFDRYARLLPARAGEAELLVQALHDAIVSERDIVPRAAEAFYDPARARASEAFIRDQAEVAAAVRARPDSGPGTAAARRSINAALGKHRKHFE